MNQRLQQIGPPRIGRFIRAWLYLARLCQGALGSAAAGTLMALAPFAAAHADGGQEQAGREKTNAMVTVSPHRLEKHVRALSDDFVPRDHAHPENLNQVAAYIAREFQQAGGEVSDQTFMANAKTYRNVLAYFGPETADRIVVGAHYDSAGPLPAADDNASGVAGVIELAYLLGRTELPIRVELVGYTLEESPFFGSHLMGSAVHASSLKRREVAVRAMLSLEMIGYFTDAPNSQEYPLDALKANYPSRGNFIGVVGDLGQSSLVQKTEQAMRQATSLPVYSLCAPRSLTGVELSDHRSYWDAGYPAVMITDTAFFRNPNYHTAGDTPDTLDYERMAMVVQGVFAAVLELSR